MISKLWLSWEKTSTTEQENRACSEVCWNCRVREARKEESGQSQTVPIAQPSYSPQGEPETNCLGVRWIVCEVDFEPDTEATEWVGGVRLDKLTFIC